MLVSTLRIIASGLLLLCFVLFIIFAVIGLSRTHGDSFDHASGLIMAWAMVGGMIAALLFLVAHVIEHWPRRRR